MYFATNTLPLYTKHTVSSFKKKYFDYLAKAEFSAGYTIYGEKCLGWVRNAKFVLCPSKLKTLLALLKKTRIS